jgi:hypothetical protein
MATAGEPKKQEILPFVYQYLKDICFDGATQLKKKFKVVSLKLKMEINRVNQKSYTIMIPDTFHVYLPNKLHLLLIRINIRNILVITCRT